MRTSLHGTTHVWVRVDLVETIMEQGSLPKNWRPRKRTRTNDMDWGWCRATVNSASTTTTSNNSQSALSPRNTQAPTASPFDVKLRKTKNRSSLSSTASSSSSPWKQVNAQGAPQPESIASVTLTVQDAVLAPPHLQNVTVSFSYQTSDLSRVCTANAWWVQDQEPPADLTSLEQLHEPAVVYCLQRRYEAEHIYTYTGKILLALNPFRVLDLYGEAIMKQYCQQRFKDRPPPHVYATAEDAYRSMTRSSQNQSILVSGESGAGKTVTTKIIMRYLATLSQRAEGNQTSERVSIESQVLQSNPILESFGNARTIRNDNSSRFGKFIEIRFNPSFGTLESGSIETYLLEKVRLIQQSPGERNYHVFYEVLSALPQRDRRDLFIANSSARDFRMTAQSGTFDRRDGVSDRDTFRELRSALDTVGFKPEEQTDLFTVVCGLLHTSNLTFVESCADASALDTSNPSLRAAVGLLGVTADALNNAFCQTMIEVGGERLFKNLPLEKAEKAVQALIKATYGALFEHIVRRINNSIAARQIQYGGKNETAPLSIGVLDIFGFESFEVNSFEQLCINYCNEALQQQFNRFVFKLEQQEYQKEGIDWSFIAFPDNQDVLDLIEKKRDGILSILDEQCRLARCTDRSFALAVYDKCSSHPRFVVTKHQEAALSFSIQHYAGLVEYDTACFLEKNKDELPKETTEFLISSDYPFLASLGAILCERTAQKSASTGNNRKPIKRGTSSLLRESVGIQFSAQLGELRTRIESTAPHYVRCLKPNDDLVPNNFNPLVIADQLRCAGVLEAIRVSRVGFPHRYFHDHFVERYGFLYVKKSKPGRGRPVAQQPTCEELVEALIPKLSEAMENSGEGRFAKNKSNSKTVFLGMQMGRTKVFLRLRAFETLEHLLNRRLDDAAIKIQAFARMIRAQTQLEIAIYAATVIQKFVRQIGAYRVFVAHRIFSCAQTIQNGWRCYRARRKLIAAYIIAWWCQSTYRGSVARQLAAYLFLDHKAAIIQRAWSRFRSTSTFRKVRRAVIFTQARFRARKAFRTLCSLRREAKDLTNVAAERDKFKEESQRLRRELELEKEKLATIRRPAPIPPPRPQVTFEVEDLRAEVRRLQMELELATQKKSPTHSEAENIRALLKEVADKTEELELLRGELESLRSRDDSFSLQSFSIEHVTVKSNLDDFSVPKKASPVRSDVSLLDAVGEQPTASSDTTPSNPTVGRVVPGLSLSYAADSMDEGDQDELRALHNSIRQVNFFVFNRLLKHGKDPILLVNDIDRYGRTALHLSAIASNMEMTNKLLDTGAAVNAQDEDGETPLHLADTSEMTELLLRRGNANPNIPNIDGICALHLAVQRRDVHSVRCLLISNANVNNADNIRWFTALHLITLPARSEMEVDADRQVRFDIARLLAGARGADLNYQDREGNTPLHYAVQLETADACELVAIFLEKGANPNICNERNQGALHLLCHNAKLRALDVFQETVHCMLFNGADPNLQSLTGCTPLHLSLYHRDINSAIQLVYRGAELHVRWKKPKRWECFWRDTGSAEILALDMVEDSNDLHRILSAITGPHKWAPPRKWCMQCKSLVGTYARALHCRHCSRFICGTCASSCLPPEYFPKAFNISDPAWVCTLCEKILIAKKESSSNGTHPSSDDDDRYSC